MADRHCRLSDGTPITILVTTFGGLNLPPTLSLSYPRSTAINTFLDYLLGFLPRAAHRDVLVSANSGAPLHPASDRPISSLLSPVTRDGFLPMRLSARLRGGKGGFGSQLRAAGGRMSSRKNKTNANPNGSNRNLDGRRMRTVDEAKRLAEYLAIKPEMETREKEERRKRWESIVEAAEKREEDILKGKAGAGQGRLDAGYVESKAEAEERMREAVGTLVESSSGDGEGEGEPDEGGSRFFGWDDDDDGESEEDEDSGVIDEPVESYEGKGKGRAS